MRTCTRWFAALGLIGFGYLLGTTGLLSDRSAYAQNDAAEAPAGQPGAASEEAQKKIQVAFEAVKAAQEVLEAESLYIPATKTVNVFGVLSGGLNAIEDLESGRGVDPETFAALYSDLATDEVRAKISKDEKGRLLYNGKLIQMYPISRLRRTFDARNALSGEKGSGAEKPAKETPAESNEEPAEEK